MQFRFLCYPNYCNVKLNNHIDFYKAIHADEYDPELMAQDFDNILEYSEICEKYDADAIDDYMEYHDSLDNFEDAYCREWKNEVIDFSRFRRKNISPVTSWNPATTLTG